VGEAVKLELQSASFGLRFLAFLLDLVVMGVLLVVLLWVIDGLGFEQWDFASQMAGISMVAVLVLVVLPAVVETLSRGRSLGKLAVGIRVVRDDGGPLAARQAITRALVAVFETWVVLGSVAFVVMLFNSRGKRVGDLLAGTYVMRTRGARLQVLSLFMPPELATWAALADIGDIGDHLALRVRQFLLRAATLSPQTRHRLAYDLAGEVGRHVAPPPPPGVHPERYLAAVLCARRDRELAAAPHRVARAQALVGTVRRLPYQIPDPPN
jgi:uncharacterized RDD family membrane protein YckC